jgi:subtilisin family serine protease
MKRENVKKFVLAFFIMFLGPLFLEGVNPSWGNDENPKYVGDELLIQHKVGVPNKKVAEVVGAAGASIISEISQIRVKQIKVPAHALEKVKEALSRNPNINFVENNFLAEAVVTPNDSYYASQWHLSKISAPQGWDISTGSTSVAVAIIDSGVDPTHPDLSNKLLPGFNFLSDNSDSHDLNGHGTAVAGSAAAISNNYTGVAGIAWQNPIMPLVVVNSSGSASYYDIAQAITYAADKGAKVMNISIAGSSNSSTLQNAVDYAWNKGAVIFAAAANYSTSTPYYPAACNNVVAVSATTSSDTLASFSNYGNWIDIAAPGVSILTTTNGGSYSSWSGTSFSSPIAAGLGALIMSANPSLTNAQVVEILKRNADDIGAPGFDPYFGYGRINVYRSLAAAKTTTPITDSSPPIVSISSPTNGAHISGGVTVSVSASDDVGVSKVELYINGILYANDATAPYNFYWDTKNYGNGAYNLEAVAYDGSGNIGESNLITVNVDNSQDTIPPVVSITSPPEGSPVSKKVTIKVTASDNVGVSKIELFIDSVLKSTVSSGTTLTYNWNTNSVLRGPHVISTKAYDSAGNVSTDSVTVYK